LIESVAEGATTDWLPPKTIAAGGHFVRVGLALNDAVYEPGIVAVTVTDAPEPLSGSGAG